MTPYSSTENCHYYKGSIPSYFSVISLTKVENWIILEISKRKNSGGNMKQVLKKIVQFIANPRLLICVLIAWMITNGWSYVLFALGTYFGIGWMAAVGGAYLAFLWLPISPEKIVTIAIAIGLLRWLFPNDQKTLAVLKDLHAKAKSALRNRKEKRKKKQEDTDSIME